MKGRPRRPVMRELWRLAQAAGRRSGMGTITTPPMATLLATAKDDWRALNRANWDERVAGLRLDRLHEHPRVAWKMFSQLSQDGDGCWTWPDRPWFPLAVSLFMTKT